jgi:hypothetical protein
MSRIVHKMASHRSRVSEPVGVVELSAALLALAAVATELGAAASAVALAASSMAEDNASVASDDKSQSVKDASMASDSVSHSKKVAIDDKPKFAKDATAVSGDNSSLVQEEHFAVQSSPSSSNCSTPRSAGGRFCVEETEEERAEARWEPCKSALTKVIRSKSSLPLTSPLQVRVVWDAKKAANVQRKDGLPVS